VGQERWEIDSGHSGIHFSVRHMVIAKVRGQFARWSGSISTVDGDPATASVEAVIDASSIETGVADRDVHLKSADFLDVANHPELTFKSTRTETLGGGRLRLVGDLTIRGTRREVALEVEYAGRTKDPWGNERAGVAAKTSIDRKDFGLTWNQVLEAGGLMVGDRVDIEIEVEAVKQAESKVA
jgi:polyisoprenoid-binding protein YceI